VLVHFHRDFAIAVYHIQKRMDRRHLARAEVHIHNRAYDTG